MANDPAFLFYPGDYLRDTQTLSEKSQVAYDRIMCEHMRNICISKQQLKFFTKKLTDDEREELMYVLTEKSGGFQIEWVAESIEKRRKYSESRRKNRSKGQNTYDEHMKTYVPHMENENVIENESEKEDETAVEVWPTFDDFWDLYDKKRDKLPSEKKWNKLKHSDKEAIMAFLPGYIKSTPDKQYRKDPTTFLNNRAWENEIIQQQKNGSRLTDEQISRAISAGF